MPFNKHVTILVPDGRSVVSSLIGPYKIFSKVNEYLLETGKEGYYNIEFVGLSESVGYYNDIISIKTHCTIHEIKKTDLIIVGAIMGDIHKSIEKNKEIIDWMRDQYRSGAEIASFCMGAF